MHTHQVGRLHWADPSQGHSGFAFLFFLFKLFYLACLFKNFRTEAGLYSQTPPPEISQCITNSFVIQSVCVVECA